MEAKKILIPESLQETLWRLAEVRQGFRRKSAADVQEALEWVLERQGSLRSYFNLFMPTTQDLSQGVRLLTGERMMSTRVLGMFSAKRLFEQLLFGNLDHLRLSNKR